MTTAKQMRQFQKALEQAREIFDEVDFDSIQLPAATQQDTVREAASVIAYFDSKESFKTKICRQCKKEFSFAYYSGSVGLCGIDCMAAHLEALGLPWTPGGRTDQERWGRYIPAVVPAVVWEQIKEQAPLLSIDEEEPAPKKMLSNETEELLRLLSPE